MKCLPLLVILTGCAVLGCWGPTRASASVGEVLSVTVYPVTATPHKFNDDMARRAGRVVATLLERAGVEELRMSDQIFAASDTSDVNEIAKAFAGHVEREQIESEFAVFAQFVGRPGTGVEAIHIVVVDKAGKVALAESAGQAQFEQAPVQPKDPMTCCVFVGQRLQQFWNLKDPLRPGAPEGRMAEFWKEDAGVPPQEELDAIDQRSEELRRNIGSASCTIFPIHVGRESDAQCAAELAGMLNEARFCRAEVAETDPGLTITPHSNEQRVLWDTAKAFREFVRKNPPDADYAVCLDYGIGGNKVHHVHVVVCNRSGEWALIDMLNSHHELFDELNPKDRADCNRLVIRRLKNWIAP